MTPAIQKLSHMIVRLLRWELPQSGIQFSALDGSAKLTDVAKHLKASEEALITAISSQDKVRVVIFKQISQRDAEVKMGACGGHGFAVHSPPGHALLSEFCSPSFVAPLVHDTGSSDAIKKSGCLSSMRRVGGINFNPRVSGGYRPRAASVVLITEEKLILAIKEGLQFFENRFSSLVFGVGKWNQEEMYWDGKIPLKYLSIEQR